MDTEDLILAEGTMRGFIPTEAVFLGLFTGTMNEKLQFNVVLYANKMDVATSIVILLTGTFFFINIP